MNLPLLNETNNKFLIIPLPEKDEFILSYLNRLKKANAYPSLKLVIHTIFGEKITLISLVKGNFNKLLLSKFTDLNEVEIDKLCIQDYQKDFYYVNCILICPFCITNKNYIPIFWYKKNIMCPIHSIPYISRCPHCNKLLNWDAEKLEICHFCNRAINLNIEKYIILHDEIIHKNNIYIVFNIFFDFKNYSPSRNKMYNLEYLCNKLRKCIKFIINPEIFIIEELRMVFVPEKLKYSNDRMAKYEFFLFILKIVKLINMLSIDGGKIKEKFIDFFDIKIFNKFSLNYENELLNLFSGKTAGFNFKLEFMIKILNIDKELLRFFLKTGFIKENSEDEVYIDDFIYSCKCISKQTSTRDIDKNFIYFNSLSDNLKLKVLKKIFYSPVYFYNFNYEDMFLNVKIDKNELNTLIL